MSGGFGYCGAATPGFLPTSWSGRYYYLTTLNGGGKFLSVDANENLYMDYLYAPGPIAQGWSMVGDGTFITPLPSGIRALKFDYVGPTPGVLTLTLVPTSDLGVQSWSYDGQGHIVIDPSIISPNLLFAFDGTNFVLYPVSEHDPSDQGALWTASGQVVSCCSYADAKNFPEEYKQYCGQSYTPGTGSNSCDVLMQQFCADSWTDDPQQPCCLGYLLNGNDLNPSDVRSMVLKTVTNNLNNIKYDPKNPNSFYTQAIPELCGAVPGCCDAILTNSFCNQFTRDDLKADPVLQKICGCFLPADQYPYTGEGISPRVCDPICIINDPIGIGQEDTPGFWSFKECAANICVIDDITIQSAVDGNINFSQVCGNCNSSSSDTRTEKEKEVGAGVCLCYFSNLTIEGGKINGDVTISQSGCGQCYTFTDDIRDRVLVDCQSGEAIGGGSAILAWIEQHYPLAIGIVIAVIIIIVGIIYFLRRRNRRATPANY